MNSIISFWSILVTVDFDVVSNFLPAMMNFSSAIGNFSSVVHGWPDGVRYALIEIISTETSEELDDKDAEIERLRAELNAKK
jgi:hypothetical protein